MMAGMSEWMFGCLDDAWKAKIATELAENLPKNLLFSLAQGMTSGLTLDVCDTKISMEHHLIHLVWRKIPRKDSDAEEGRLRPSLADFCSQPTVPLRRRRRNSKRKQKGSVNDDSLSDDLNPAPSQPSESSPVQSTSFTSPFELPSNDSMTPPAPKAPDIDSCELKPSISSDDENDDCLSVDPIPAPSQSPESSPVQPAKSPPSPQLQQQHHGSDFSSPPLPKAPDIKPCELFPSTSSPVRPISAPGVEEIEQVPAMDFNKILKDKFKEFNDKIEAQLKANSDASSYALSQTIRSLSGSPFPSSNASFNSAHQPLQTNTVIFSKVVGTDVRPRDGLRWSNCWPLSITL